MKQLLTKGDDRRQSILAAAHGILIDQGYSRFTMRRVASAAGISLGNLNYHYPRKDDLLKALLEHIVDAYVSEFDRRRVAAGSEPRRQLAAVLEFWIDDLSERDTTVFFPELWALANHNKHAADLTDLLYRRAREPIEKLIPLVNPRLSSDDAAQIALVMCASMEGLTIFAGYDKPWSEIHSDLKQRLIDSFLRMIEG